MQSSWGRTVDFSWDFEMELYAVAEAKTKEQYVFKII